MSKISSTKGWLFQLTASQGNWHRLHWYPLQHKSHFNSRPRERPTCTVLMPLETASYFNSRPRERPTLWFFHAPCNTYISTHDLVRGRHGRQPVQERRWVFQLTTSWEADSSGCWKHFLRKHFNSRPRERPTQVKLAFFHVNTDISTHDLVRGRLQTTWKNGWTEQISTHDLVRGRPHPN